MRISDWSSDVCSSDLIRERVNRYTIACNLKNGGIYAARSARKVRELEHHQALWQRYGSHHLSLHEGSEIRDHVGRSEEHTSELQSLMRTSYAVFCLKKKKKTQKIIHATEIACNQLCTYT